MFCLAVIINGNLVLQKCGQLGRRLSWFSSQDNWWQYKIPWFPWRQVHVSCKCSSKVPFDSTANVVLKRETAPQSFSHSSFRLYWQLTFRRLENKSWVNCRNDAISLTTFNKRGYFSQVKPLSETKKLFTQNRKCQCKYKPNNELQSRN